MIEPAGQSLIFDADDTLWQNNIYFEDAVQEFIRYLDHSSMRPEEVRGVLDEIELANRETQGYGALNFGMNLKQCYRHLCERETSAADLEHVMALAERILEQPVELIEGVEATLAYLCGRHQLLLFTKGHPEEQKMKIERSGLGRHFSHAAIVREKDMPSYSDLMRERALDPARTWMIGNSPKV